MAAYHEIAPSPRLAAHVECFWTLRVPEGEAEHRVLPDGCTDLVFSTGRGLAVGTMTRAMISPVMPCGEVFGVRFHPGMSHGMLKVPVAELTDQAVDLPALWGRQGTVLIERVSNARSDDERIEAIEALLDPPDVTPMQRAALFVIENRGEASADDLARHAGLSARQFRRQCIEQTGVGPKMLCRIVRFRNAANDIARRPASWADFALDHGYYDQAHFINEFKELSGLTPAAYASVFSNTAPDDTP